MDQHVREKSAVTLKISAVLLVLFPLASLIICLVIKRDLVDDDILMAHYRWQMRTLIGGLVLYFAGFVLSATGIGALLGMPLIFGTGIWILYRAIRGFIRLNTFTLP